MSILDYIKDEEALRRLEGFIGQSYVPETSILEVFRLVRSKDILAKTSVKVRSDRRIMFAAVKYDGSNLKYACNELKKDRELVLAALNNSGLYIYADRTLFKDRSFVLAAVKADPNAIQAAGSEFKEDEEIMHEAIKGNPAMIKHAGENIRGNRGIITEVINRDWKLFQYASEELKNDRGMVFEAVRVNPNCLQYAGEGPRNDREVVMTAIDRETWMIRYIGDRLKNDPSFAGEVLIKHESYMYSFKEEVLYEVARDEALVLSILKTKLGIMEYVTEPLKSNREFAAKALKANASALNYLNDELKRDLCNDRDVLLAALGHEYGHRLLKYTGQELLSDAEFIKNAVKVNGKSLNYFGREVMKDEAIVITAFEHGYCNSVRDLSEVTEDYGYLVEYRELRNAIVRDPDRTEQEKCIELSKKLGIRCFVHFTNVKNLGSILERGMMTRQELDERGITNHPTDERRQSGQMDTFCLSIEEPNRRMFLAKRIEHPDWKWCVILLNPETVLKNKCYFLKYNAANHMYNDAEVARCERYTVLDFLNMFEYNFEDRKLRTADTQCEIMCTARVPADAIISIMTNSEEMAESLRKQYGGKIPFKCDPWYFK